MTYGDNGWRKGDTKTWKDTFSSGLGAERHKMYAGEKAEAKIPMFVVDGKPISPSYSAPMLESKRQEVKEAIGLALESEPRFNIDGRLTETESEMSVSVFLSDSKQGESDGIDVKVVPVLLQKEAVVSPTTGWNKGKTWNDHFIAIRALDPIDPASAFQTGGVTVNFELPENAEAEDYCVAILIEDSTEQAILECRTFFLERRATGHDDVDPEMIEMGTAAYNKGMCAKCHGASGAGTNLGPDLTDSDWIHCDGSATGIHGVLLSGVSKTDLHDKSHSYGMNPATNLIKDEEALAALSHYIISLGKK